MDVALTEFYLLKLSSHLVLVENCFKSPKVLSTNIINISMVKYSSNRTFGPLKQHSPKMGYEDNLNKQNSLIAAPILQNWHFLKFFFCTRKEKINISMVKLFVQRNF